MKGFRIRIRFGVKDQKNMNYRLKDVVDTGDTISYEYDFGSTTELILKIHSSRTGEKNAGEIVILSRNNPPEIICSNCGCKKVKWVNPYADHEGLPFWCEDCLKEDEDDDEEDFYEPEFLLPVCNSPRMGVCGYEGSDVYPD